MESPDDTPSVNEKAAKEITPAANAANGLSAESTSEEINLPNAIYEKAAAGLRSATASTRDHQQVNMTLSFGG